MKKKVAALILLAVLGSLGLMSGLADAVMPAPKTNADTLNLYYGLKSYEQFNSLLVPIKDGSGKEVIPLDKVGSMAFHWGEVSFNATTKSLRYANNVPKGYEEPLKISAEHGVETYYSVFMNTGFDQLFTLAPAEGQDQAAQSASANWLMNQLDKQFLSKSTVTGIVIDFEALPKAHQQNYLDFLTAFDALAQTKGLKLWVAVAPGTVADYNQLLGTVDRVVLMLHDYEAKKLSVSRVGTKVMTPLVPISKLERDISAVVGSIKDKKQLEKLSLQFNMASAQWKLKDGKLMNADSTGTYALPYRPEYSTLIGKWQSLLKAKTPLEAGYSEVDQSPYLHYLDPTDNSYNTISYENVKSIDAKVKLAKKYGITHFSVWRLGNIPKESTLGLDLLSYVLSLPETVKGK